MGTIDYLLLAYEEKRKTEGAKYKIYEDRSFFATVYKDVAREMYSWAFGIEHLVNIGNWRLQRLIQEDGSIRKPRAYLCVELTSKRNFALNWYPEMPVRHKLDETDWLYWGDSWGPDSRPTNRILMIHGLDFYIYTRPGEKAFDKAEGYLLRAVRSLLGDIYAFLDRVISTEIVEDFYLEYDEAKPLVDRKLKKCRIRKVEEVEREREEQKREEWLQNTFKEELGISPEDFLIAFKSTELRYFPTAKQLSSKIKKQVKLSPTRVKSLSIRLFNEYPEIYDKILEQPPKGLEPRKAGKIIHIDFGNKG